MFELVDEMIEGKVVYIVRRAMALSLVAEEVMLWITQMKTSMLPAKILLSMTS